MRLGTPGILNKGRHVEVKSGEAGRGGWKIDAKSAWVGVRRIGGGYLR